MKVFISHSHKDKWIAEQVAERIESVGINVFLDTKQVRYGDRIQQTVNDNLKDSDDVVIIVTPSAKTSEWIPFEVGVASGLGKNIVPILHYIEKNEVPEILQDRARLDLNELDSYVNQLVERMHEKKGVEIPIDPIPKHREKNSSVKPPANRPAIGSQVKLPPHPPAEAIRSSENIGWVPGMNPYLGRSGKVLEIDEDDSAKLDVDGGKYWYAFEWLETV